MSTCSIQANWCSGDNLQDYPSRIYIIVHMYHKRLDTVGEVGVPYLFMEWQISEPAFYEAIAPSDGCTDGFASRVREFANSIPPFVRRGAAGAPPGSPARDASCCDPA